jgi:iron complex transport system substrate-binding protein
VLAIPSPANRLPVESMVDLGLRVVVVDPNRIDSVYATIRRVAGLLGDSATGEKLITDMRERVARIAKRLEGVERRRVLVLVGRQPLIGAGGGTYQDEIVALAGGTNLAAQVAGEWPTLSLEFVLAGAPEVIIDAGMGSEEESEADRKAFWQQYAAIPAVRDGRVFGYRAYELLRPGPRLPETLAAVAHFIHPERFALPAE